MTRWGRGWEVGVKKAIDAHERTRREATVILAEEHGTRHEPGARPDLCPKCTTPQVDTTTTQEGRP